MAVAYAPRRSRSRSDERVENGVSLGQLATEAKSNEITAIPELIDNLDVSGAIVTIDAAGCQKNIASQVIDAGGDFIFTRKGNQGNLCKAPGRRLSSSTEVGMSENEVRDAQPPTRTVAQARRGHPLVATSWSP